MLFTDNMEVILTAYLAFEGLSIWKVTPIIKREELFVDDGLSSRAGEEEDLCRAYAQELGERAVDGHVPTHEESETLARLSKKVEEAKNIRKKAREKAIARYNRYVRSHVLANWFLHYTPLGIPLFLSLSLFACPPIKAFMAGLVLLLFLLKTAAVIFYFIMAAIVRKAASGSIPNESTANVYGLDDSQKQ